MNEKLSEALDHISENHIAEAAKAKKKHRPYWIGAVAAVLALVIILNLPGTVLSTRAGAVSVAEYPEYQWVYRPEMDAERLALKEFFGESMHLTLSGTEGENQAYSPINLYMALAVAAEITGGRSRRQILTALDAESMDALRAQANLIWNATYYDDNDQTLLANSLWLEEGLAYDQSVMDTLASNYYTSVYMTDLGTADSDQAIRAWLNQQTGGLLKSSTDNIQLDPKTVLTLFSTVYFQAKWGTEFSKSMNTNDIFHAPGGDRTVTYMNKEEYRTNYYWGEDFTAVALPLNGGSHMWFILPDADKTVEDVLSAGEYLELLIPEEVDYSDESEHHKYMKVNFSVPKFDITAGSELTEDLKTMGITNMFDERKADFGSIIDADFPVWFDSAIQATRVAIDEEGVTAASYIGFPGYGEALPPEEVVDFILDRPFIFVITSRYDLPLFAGVVNEP